MTITENYIPEKKAIELVVSGRLDTTTAPQLESKVKQVSAGIQLLYLNLKDVEYVSSAGLRVVLLAHKITLPNGGKTILRSPSPFCMQVLEATGMDSILNIE